MEICRQKVMLICYSGGVRGIVALEVLRELEKYLGGKIHIQDFFDLIVGTRYIATSNLEKQITNTDCSTGGILALGLGVERWTVQECISKFTRLATQAFTPKLLGGIENVGIRYKTKPMEAALKEVFQTEKLFGGKHVDAGSYYTKVAVTAATKTAGQAVIFGNYNRDVEPLCQHDRIPFFSVVC